jgi:hypothetical protein
MFKKLGIIGLFLIASSAGSAAIQAEIDYMPMFSDEMVKQWVDGSNFRQWQVHINKIGPKFVEMRNVFATRLRSEAVKQGVNLPPIDQLPHPQLHRMIFNLFAKKANFLTKPGEQVAFLAKVYLDLDCIKWSADDDAGGAKLNRNATKEPIPRFPMTLNCNGFIKFCLYMAGLPRVVEEAYGPADWNRMPKGERIMQTGQVLDNSRTDGWSGWYKTARDTATGWPAEPAKVEIEPGDLISLYTQSTSPGPNGGRVLNSFSWNHVEVVQRGCQASGPPSKLEHVMSIGNSTHPLTGSEVHYTYVWGKLSGTGRWLDTLAPKDVNGDKVVGHRQAIFKPRDRFADGKAKNPEKFILGE